MDRGRGRQARTGRGAGTHAGGGSELHRRLSPDRPLSAAIAGRYRPGGRRRGRGSRRRRDPCQAGRPHRLCERAAGIVCRGPGDAGEVAGQAAAVGGFRNRGRHDAQRAHRAVPVSPHLQTAAWPDDPVPCCRRRRRTDRDAVGKGPGSHRHRHCRFARESGTGACPRLRPCDPLQGGEHRRAGAGTHGREDAAGGLRRRRQGYLRCVAGLPAAIRADGQLRQRVRARCRRSR